MERGMSSRKCINLIAKAFYAWDAKLHPNSCLRDHIRGTNPLADSRLEMLADGMMLYSLIMRDLITLDREMLIAEYLPWTAENDSRKLASFRYVGKYIGRVIDKPRGLCTDVVREQCGYRKRRSYGQWAEKFGVSARTIHNWALRDDLRSAKGQYRRRHQLVHNKIEDRLISHKLMQDDYLNQ